MLAGHLQEMTAPTERRAEGNNTNAELLHLSESDLKSAGALLQSCHWQVAWWGAYGSYAVRPSRKAGPTLDL